MLIQTIGFVHQISIPSNQMDSAQPGPFLEGAHLAWVGLGLGFVKLLGQQNLMGI